MMTTDEKKRFITDELYHELRCLLGSATIWKIFSDAERGYEVIVAEDSVFLHARILLEFFTAKGKNTNTLRITEFGPSKYTSQLYSKWKVPLNRHSLHLNAQRLRPNNVRAEEHLNEQVLNLAHEVLGLWVKFEGDAKSADFHEELKAARMRAIADAINDTNGRIEPIFKAEV